MNTKNSKQIAIYKNKKEKINKNSYKNVRLKNWEIRKRSLSNDNNLDIEFNNGMWKFNTTLKSKHPMSSFSSTSMPLIILHDDKSVIQETLKELFKIYNVGDFEKYFNTITSRVDKRFGVYPFRFPDGSVIVFIWTGIGSAQTNYVMEILAAVNIERVLKFGTFSSLNENIGINEVMFVESAYSDEGTSQYTFDYILKMNKRKIIYPYGNITNELKDLLTINLPNKYHLIKEGIPKRVISTDAYESFDLCTDMYELLVQNGISGVEMECSSLFSCSQKFRMQVAAILSVSRTQRMMKSKYTFPLKIKKDSESVLKLQKELIIDILKLIGYGR